jgi:mannose-1-phosphate guanylyltransferase
MVTAVADEAAATGATGPTTDTEYFYIPFPTGCTDDCTGYVLKAFIERPTDTTSNPYVKLGLNND